MGFIIPNSQTNLDPVVFIRGGGFINIRTVVFMVSGFETTGASSKTSLSSVLLENKFNLLVYYRRRVKRAA